MRVWDAGLAASLAALVWWQRRLSVVVQHPTRDEVTVVAHGGVKFLVAHSQNVSSGRTRRTILGAQFVERPDVPAFRGWVLQHAAYAIAGLGSVRTACVVGAGAGSTARYYRAAGLETDAYEISPRVAELAEREFGAAPVTVGDGLAALKTERYDLVSIDCFDGRGASFAALRADVLRPLAAANTFLCLNFVLLRGDDADDEHREEAVAARLVRRVRRFYRHARAFRDNNETATTLYPSNVVIYASNEPLEVEARTRFRGTTTVAPDTPEWTFQAFKDWEVGLQAPVVREAEDDDWGFVVADAADYEARAAEALARLTDTYLPPPVDDDDDGEGDQGSLFAACVGLWCYVLWMRWTDACKRSPDDFGPDAVARAVRSATRFVMRRLVGIDWRVVGDEHFYEKSTTTAKKKKKKHDTTTTTKGAAGPSSVADPPAATSAFPRGAVGLVSPHGAYPLGAMFHGIPHFRCERPALRLRVGAASVLFYVPVVREYLLLFGAREVTRATIETLVDAGCCVACNPGGIVEMVHQRSDMEVVFVMPNLGLFKCAIRKRVPVVLMYGFGEAQTFTCHRRFEAARAKLAALARVGLPWISGRFGLSLGPVPVVPHPGTIVHVAASAGDGGVIPVDTWCDRLLEDESNLHELAVSLFEVYKTNLTALFDRHKDAFLPPEVAKKGLTVVWLGHDPLPRD